MTVNGVTPRLTAVLSLLGAAALLVLVWGTAPTRAPAESIPTPTLIPAPVYPTLMPLLLAGSPVPHGRMWVEIDYRVSPTPLRGAP